MANNRRQNKTTGRGTSVVEVGVSSAPVTELSDLTGQSDTSSDDSPMTSTSSVDQLAAQSDTKPISAELSTSQLATLEAYQTKSAKIRYLHQLGWKTTAISKTLNVRYQHVRNVLSTELKRGPNEIISFIHEQ